jgi:hypothetical protein
MTTLSAAGERTPAMREQAVGSGLRAEIPPSPETRDSSAAWGPATWAGLVAFVALWTWKLYSTWAAWGNLTVDSGHEMYVPWMLSKGKMLYRDVWFLYGPAGPYINSWLFRMFGPHLNVLYWAGSLSALGSAVFLYLVGIRLSSRLAGWTAGAVILLEAFQPSLFCFPLPYSFSTVYGCLVGCAFLWFVVSACTRKGWSWVLGAGTTSAIALLLKPEFGMACYATLVLLIATQCYLERSWKPLAIGAAASLPGVLVCALVIRWMVSIAGVEFITQENIMSWPTSYFMRTYGKLWLEVTGFTLSGPTIRDSFSRTIPLLGLVMLVYSLVWWKRADLFAKLTRAMLALTIPGLLAMSNYDSLQTMGRSVEKVFAAVFFPQDMVVYVSLAAAVAWWLLLRRRRDHPIALLALVLSYSALLSFRILMGMEPRQYAIYYNGPVVLSFLLILFLPVPRTSPERPTALAGRVAICLGCLAAVFLMARREEAFAKNYIPLRTERGTVRVTKMRAENYAAAIQFMKEKAALGEPVLSIPEDTGLYFLSGTECPTRVYVFDPGVHAPGKMTDEAIREIEAKSVRYLIWSNRTFPEYRAPVFGKDFDVPLGDYLKAHYRPVGRLVNTWPSIWDWTAVVWERKPEAEIRQSH